MTRAARIDKILGALDAIDCKAIEVAQKKLRGSAAAVVLASVKEELKARRQVVILVLAVTETEDLQAVEKELGLV